MYNDTIKVANKIISAEDLFDIFSKMQEKLIYYKKISENEERKNQMLEWRYQTWTFRDSNSSLSFEVDFHDDTNIRFDNYNNFISVFNNRLQEIKSIYVHFYLSYGVQDEDKKSENYRHSISMWIYENKVKIEVSLNSEDRKIDDIYELIKSKILQAPEKYDKVIKKKSKITAVVGLAIGFIPALIISTLLLFVPTIRHIFAVSYVLYPMCSLVLAFLIGGIFGSAKLDRYYEKINPEQKYAGYDSNKGKSIYKDDIDQYVETSEILIGKNVDNLKCRKEIMANFEKFKRYIPYELGAMLLLSIITLFLGGI